MAVAFDAVGPSSSGAGSATATLSYTHTAVASGVALLAGVAVGQNVDGAFSVTATCDGSSMTALTALVHTGGSNAGFIRLFGAAGLASGAHTVAFTASGGTPNSMSGGSVSFSGADQSSPFGTPVTATGNSSTASTSITASASTSMIFAMVGDGSGASTGWSGATSRWVNGQGGFQNGAGDTEGATVAATGSSQTISDTIATDLWAIILVEVRVSGGAVPLLAASFTPPGLQSPMAWQDQVPLGQLPPVAAPAQPLMPQVDAVPPGFMSPMAWEGQAGPGRSQAAPPAPSQSPAPLASPYPPVQDPANW